VLLGPKPNVASHGRSSGRPPGTAYSIALAVWAAAVALDKRTKLIAARRAALRGIVVLADRYPQSETAAFNDGALLRRLTHVPEWMRLREEAIYHAARHQPPDLVIKLVATPGTIAAREPSLEPSVIIRRLEALNRLGFGGATTVVIDAGQPREAVLRAAKAAIWNTL
jgi:hypothetical protein